VTLPGGLPIIGAPLVEIGCVARARGAPQWSVSPLLSPPWLLRAPWLPRRPDPLFLGGVPGPLVAGGQIVRVCVGPTVPPPGVGQPLLLVKLLEVRLHGVAYLVDRDAAALGPADPGWRSSALTGRVVGFSQRVPYQARHVMDSTWDCIRTRMSIIACNELKYA
jgi:hypothetical protein